MISKSHVDDPILQRRRQLRRQRQLKLLQATWRSLATAGLTLGLLWGVSQPEWMLRQPSQVLIKGNRLIATQTLQNLLPLTYPQSLIRLQPQVLTNALETHAPIHNTVITRQLLPPRLIIEVQERSPVAIVTCDRADTNTVAPSSCILTSDPNPSTSVIQGPATVWLLDNQGIALPLESFPGLEKERKLPQLKVMGLFQPVPSNPALGSTPAPASAGAMMVTIDPEKKSHWQTLYPLLSRSPVRIFALDWHQKNNLILKTELGLVHLGPYSAKFADQLHALDQMRQLPNYLNTTQVAYIDLENPDQPLLQLRRSKNSQQAVQAVKTLP